MAKLAIFGFLVLFALAHAATAFKTTITTTMVEDVENPGWGRLPCQEQIRRQQQLRHCQMHLREQCRSRRSMLSMLVENPGREEGEQYLNQCCQQLWNIDEQCRCGALQQVVDQVAQQQRQEGEEARREVWRKFETTLFREGREVLSRCNVRPRSCTFSRPRW